MKKKLSKHGNSLALIIDKPILKALGITEKTPLTVLVSGNSIIIKTTSTQKNKKELIKTADRIIKKYEPVFKKLAKS